MLRAIGAKMASFEAFQPSVVVDEFARKIEALCVWKDTLIAGLSDGSLLFFNEQNTEDGAGTTFSTWQVTRVQKSFGKRGILQLQALDNQPYLLSLSDEGVHLHTLPELQLVSAASRTARAGAFSWDGGRQLLVTAMKKKVLSHQLDSSNTFLEMTEYNLPDPVHALSWVGSNILLGTAKSYWLIVPAAAQTVEVLPGQVMTIYPAVQPQLLFAAGSHPPVMAHLPSGEVLITKDAVSYFLGPDGKPSRKTTLTWSQPPTALAASKLYVAGLLPSAVEVKSVSRVGAAAAEQMLLLPGMAVAAPAPAPDGCLYIASATTGGIRQLQPVPLERQAKLLAAAGDFQGALELLTLLEDEEAFVTVITEEEEGTVTVITGTAGGAGEVGGAARGDRRRGGGGLARQVSAAERRQRLEDVLRLRFGYHLFEAGEPDEALTQFSMCSDPDPLLLLRLYPSLVPDKFVPLLPSSAYGEPLPDTPAAAAAATAGSGGGSGSGNSSSSSNGGVKDGSSSIGVSVDAAAALAVVVPYLLSHRTRLLASLEEAAARGSSKTGEQGVRPGSSNSTHHNGTAAAAGRAGSSSSSSDGSSSMDVDAAGNNKPSSSSSGSSSKERSYQELKLIATVIDTAILRAMLLQPDSGALLRLLQQVNYVDLEDGEAVLAAAGRYAELAALFQYNRRHQQGLELLQKLSQQPEGLPVTPRGAAADLKGLPGVWAAVRYLVALQPQDLQLLVGHAGWILGSDPEAGLEALLAMNPPLKPELVIPIMQAHAPAYTAVYLESALDLGLVAPGEVHSELLLIYLHMALEEEREGEVSSEAHARQLSLSDLLVSRPHQPLKLFPDDRTQWGAPTPRTSTPGAGTPGYTSGTPGYTSGTLGYTSGTLGYTSGTARPATGKTAAAAVQSGEDGEAAVVEVEQSRAVSPSPHINASLADPNHPHHRRDAYQRLRELVYASDHIDPDYVLSKLGQGQLLEIRALMLERLGRHREALSVYIHDLEAMQLAEQYCDRVYEAGLAAAAGPGVTPGVTPGMMDGTAGDAGVIAAGSASVGSSRGVGITGEWVPAQRAAAAAGKGAAAAAAAGIGFPRPGSSIKLSASATAAAGRRLAGAAAGGSWGCVQQQQHKGRQQQQQQSGGSSNSSSSRRGWSALPFGVRPHDIYMELVDAVLQGPDKQGASATGAAAAQRQQQQQQVIDDEAWKELAHLLSRKSDRINHTQILGMLPQQLPLADVGRLLSSMVLHNTEQKRNLAVVQALRKAENLMAREDLVKVKQRVVTLTFDRACCICHKRMGGAVSVAYPNGSLAHYLCYKRSTGQQQQGQPLWESALPVPGAGGGGGAAAVWSQQQQQQQGVAGEVAGDGSSSSGVEPGGGWGGMMAAVAH